MSKNRSLVLPPYGFMPTNLDSITENSLWDESNMMETPLSI
jgi:hypothetical protein